MEDSLYLTRPGGRYLPTRLSQGPWAPDRQHGGPVAALLACVLESAAPPGWLTPQLTVDFLSAVPMAELAANVEVVKDGHRARSLDATLADEGQVFARARAWQVAPGRIPDTAVPRSGAKPATADPVTPDAVTADAAAAEPTAPGSATPDPAADPAAAAAAPPPLPEESSYGRASFRFGYQEAVETRFVRGSFRERAPATAWARLLVPLLPDAACSPLQRVAAVADFGSGISAILDRAAWNYHNLDLSLHLHRQPAGEWICLEAASLVGPDATGTCLTMLHDATGPVGAAAQSLLVTAARR